MSFRPIGFACVVNEITPRSGIFLEKLIFPHLYTVQLSVETTYDIVSGLSKWDGHSLVDLDPSLLGHDK